MKRIWIFSALLLMLCACGESKSQKQEYDIYLLIGQSNMAGRGDMIEADTLSTIEGVWLLDSLGVPQAARNPLNLHSSIRKGVSVQRISPATAFSSTIHQLTGRPVLLVVNARGGTALREWMPGTHYFNEAVRRTREAMHYGKLKAILWHQGESDSKDPADYLDRLAEMVGALRSELGEVPFVAGEIAREHPNADRFNPVIAKIGDAIPHSDYVSSEGCTLRVGDPHNHFTREGQLILGARYAEKVKTMIYE